MITECFSQNLVLNPSFEEYTKCPESTDELSFSKKWINPSKSSPDYFNICCNETENKTVGVPCNFNGCKNAHSGNAYSGIAIWSSDPKYKEYIQTTLKSKLITGKKYSFSLWFCMADSSHFQSNGVSICFSRDQKLGTGNVNDGGIILSSGGKSQWCVFKKSIDHKVWFQITGIHTASGDEEFLTVGIFKDDGKRVKTKRVKTKRKDGDMMYAYYYIDDIELIALD